MLSRVKRSLCLTVGIHKGSLFGEKPSFTNNRRNNDNDFEEKQDDIMLNQGIKQDEGEQWHQVEEIRSREASSQCIGNRPTIEILYDCIKSFQYSEQISAKTRSDGR